MGTKEFLALKLGKSETATVNAIQLQNVCRENRELSTYKELNMELGKTNSMLVKKIEEMERTISSLKNENEDLKSKNRLEIIKLKKANDELSYKLGLSNAFLDHHKTQREIDSLGQNGINVDLTC